MAYCKTKTTEQGIKRFQLEDGLTHANLKEISAEIRSSIKTDDDSTHFVIDLMENNVEFEMLRPLTILGSELKTVGKRLCLLSERRKVLSLISSEGLSGVILPISSLEEIIEKKSAGPKGTTIDVDFINPFIEGVMHVLKVQCSLECRPGRPYLKEEGSGVSKVDIAGVIGISNPRFMGSISVCFSERAFLLIMSKMFAEEYTEITKDLEDGAGEILNMVFGHAKRILNEKNYGLEKALPTVVRGSGVSLSHVSDQNTIILPFMAEDLGFHMEICTEKK